MAEPFSPQSPDFPASVSFSARSDDWHEAGLRARAEADLEGAASAYRSALALDPSREDSRLALASVLWDSREVSEMIEVLNPIGPDSPGFHAAENMRGFLAVNMGKPRQARDAFRRALELAPTQVSYYSNFLLSLLYDVDLPAEKVAKAHADFGLQAARAAGEPDFKEGERDPERRLRVGFLSSDFRFHSVAYFIEPLFSSWNHDEAELVLYSGVARGDEMTRLLEKCADRTVSLVGLDGARIVDVIREDAPDILIELGGHTSGNFSAVLSRRVAPVQLSWLGYPHSSGLQTIDGRLSDGYLEPLPSAQRWSVEPILHLPRVAFAFRMPGRGIPVGPLPYEKNGFPTFVCSNSGAKISEPILERWIELLRRVPDARLLIKNSGFAYPPRAKEVIARFAQRGVAPERVELRNPTASIAEHLGIYQEADVALDTYPYNGTTTTCEALWMGVPVVGLVGESAVSRHTPRILDAVGLSDWVTISGEAYVDRAVAAVRDRKALAAVRANLRARFQASPLGQYTDFADGFQALLRTIWGQHRAGETLASAPPAPRGNKSITTLRQEGISAVEAMDWAAAVEAWSAILEAKPHHSEALGYLGLIEKTRGNLDESLRYWEEAIKRSPKNPGLWGNLGEVLRHLRRYPEAQAALEKAVAFQPAKHDARLGLATTLWDQRKLAEALQTLAKIPESSPHWAGAKNMEGNIVSHLGHPAAAQEAYRHAMEANPNSALFHSNYLLSLLYDAHSTGDSMAEAHFEYGRKYDARAEGVPPPEMDPVPGRKLRIAFFSSDFRMHSVAFFFEPLLSSLDRDAYEVFLYSGVVNPDEMSRTLYAQAVAVRSMVGETPASLLAQARKDRLDVVVDLGGHTGNNSLPILAQRLAPVQFSWLGYPHSTGLSNIGYRLSDDCLEPLPDAQKWSSEEIVHLEDGCHTYRLPGEGIPVSPLPLARADGPTFICCNNSAKISPTSLDLFARVLEAVPSSRLILKNSGFTYPPRAAEIHRYFTDRGIALERVELRPLTKTVRQHLETYCEADVALDTYPYNGTTTTCEALWMGLPVVSLAGDTAVSRHSASLLRQVEMEDWAVDTVDDYVKKASEAIEDSARLARLRAGLRERFRGSPLGDADWFARRFEYALRTVWCDLCATSSGDPSSIESARAMNESALEEGRARHWLTRGQAAVKAGLDEIAADWLRRAGETGIEPTAWIELGRLGETGGNLSWSMEGWGHAIRAFPERADVWAAWAETLRVANRCSDACKAYEEALKRAPEFPGVWMNFSATCRLANRPVRAEEAARKAIALKEDFPEAWNNLGGALRDQGRYEEAIEAWVQALHLRPDDLVVHSNLLYMLNAVPGLSGNELRAQHQAFGQRHFPECPRVTHPTRKRAGRPWRVGFLSPDLRDHSVAKFLRGVLPAMRTAGFEIVAFADVARPDAVSAAIKSQVHRWTTTATLDDGALIESIRSQDLDILIELSGHTAGHRLHALKERVAPLYLSWLGYPTALECGVTDYFLADTTIYPDGDRPDEVLPLQGGALVYGPEAEMRSCEVLEPDAPLTFGAFHSFHKLNEPLWREWTAVLDAFPGSRLKVKARALSDDALVEQWHRNLKAWGVPLARLELVPFAAAGGGHLEDWRDVDIALDAHPYNGVTTTAEAMSMGVPVITYAGPTPADRHAASLLRSVGFEQYIATDWKDAIARIRKLVTNLEELRRTRVERSEAFRHACTRRSTEWVVEFQDTLYRLFQEIPTTL